MKTSRFAPARIFPWLLGLWLGLSSAPAQTSNPYENEIRAFETADQRNPPPTNAVLFVGSSSIRMWTGLAAAFPDYHVLNRGFGGSQASDVLHFFDRVVAPYRPPLVVFYEGDNDIAGGKSVDTVFGDWTRFVDLVRAALPETHVMFLSVKPSPSRASFQARVAELNERVRRHCATDPRLRYTDVFTPMLNAGGQPRPELFGPDDLHMNAAGYALWNAVVGPALDAWAAEYPVPVQKPRTGGLLIDFGDAAHPSGGGGPVSAVRWNNVTPSIAASGSGVLAGVVAADGSATGVSLRMTARFNGANESGTAAASVFPATATRDSLYGNTASFNNLANIFPVFRLAGLDPATTYRFTFYASRLGASDNRQTRYTVTGASTAFTDLDASANVEETAVVSAVQPDAGGELSVALTPGPANNNANRFTYLGVLRVDPVAPAGPGMLFDFGATGAPTGDQAPVGPAWNDLTATIGATDNGRFDGLVDTNGAPTGIAVQMVSRFNGANANGTQNATLLPASATRDSLFGNTEPFNGLADVRPVFKLTGLDPSGLYALTFHASRDGVGDHREARYTATGAGTAFADLDASTNRDRTVTIPEMRPDPAGEIALALAPGPNNDNANHFVYLGSLRVDWAVPPPVAPRITVGRAGPGSVRLDLRGPFGRPFRLESSVDLADWVTNRTGVFTNGLSGLEFPATEPRRFFRLAE